MPFTHGQVSFSTLVVSPGPASSLSSAKGASDAMIDALVEHAFHATDLGIPLETETGWTTAEHLFDLGFEHGKCVYADNGALLAGLRIDTNRAPAEIKRALRAQHETVLAAGNPSGHLSKAQKREAKELTEHDIQQQLSSGKYRRSTMSQWLWDIPGRRILTASSATRVIEILAERYRGSFDGAVKPASSGTLAYEWLSDRGLTRDYEDARPSPFTNPPMGRDGEEIPEIPWASMGPEPRDFLGNEFLLWLWYRLEEREGEIELPQGSPAKSIAIAMDKSIDLECAWGIGGKVSVKGADEGVSPIRLSESIEALRRGKWPRKAGMILADGDSGEVYRFTLQADRWLFSSVALPMPEEGFETAHEEREHRIAATLRLDALMRSAFGAFLQVRMGESWGTLRSKMRGWITEQARPSAQTSMVEGKPTGEVAVV